MALSNADLDGFESEVEQVPSKTQGVSVSSIPQALVTLLEKQAPQVLDRKDKEIILKMAPKAPKPEPVPDVEALPEGATKAQQEAHAKALESHKEAVEAHRKAVEVYAEAEKAAVSTIKQLCLYASAWGKGQEPKLYVHKVMNRKDMPAWHARLSVESWDKVPPENRPGRPPTT